jgi:hypothetical protein
MTALPWVALNQATINRLSAAEGQSSAPCGKR